MLGRFAPKELLEPSRAISALIHIYVNYFNEKMDHERKMVRNDCEVIVFLGLLENRGTN